MPLIETFQHFATRRGSRLGKPGASTEEIDSLWAEYDNLNYSALRRASDGADPDFLILQVSIEFITSIMGKDWTTDRIINFVNSDASKHYLDLGDHISHRALREYRITELARRLYEFQSFEWYPLVVSALRTGDVGSVAFELDTLWLLMIASPSVGTHAEVSERGKDFDCYALMQDVVVPVEVKAKTDRTPWTLNTIKNTVRGAARQLPKGSVGVLFVRVPFGWIGPQLENEFSEALAEGTRQTSRVGAIVAVFDKPSLSTGKPVNRHLGYFREPSCPDHIWEFCMRLRQFWDAELTLAAPSAPF